MIVALIWARGNGDGVEIDRPVQFIEIDDRPIVAYTIEIYEKNHSIDSIGVVCRPEWKGYLEETVRIQEYKKVRWIIDGGQTFHDSIAIGLDTLNGHLESEDTVLIHDATAPFTSQEIVNECIRVTAQRNSAFSATPCFQRMVTNDILISSKETESNIYINDRMVRGSKIWVDGNEYVQVAYPQGFKLGYLNSIYDRARKFEKLNGIESHVTTLAQALGDTIYQSFGEQRNIKITTAEDIDLFKRFAGSFKRIDLHTHSTASDGQYTPSELVEKAVKMGIKTLAITDHDTVDGVAEGRLKATELGIVFISGIEISTQDDITNEEIHILGFDIDVENEKLLSECQVWRKARMNRGKLIKEYLEKRGITIDLDQVKIYAGDGNLGRPHFARYLVEAGIVDNRKQAFDKYLDTSEFIKATSRKKPKCKQAIDLIHQAGGKAVLAHPGIYKITEKELDSLVERLAEQGIDGIECFYSKHTDAQTKHYIELAKGKELKVSCGSDFHGEKVKPNVRLGMDFDICQYGERLITMV